MSAANIPTRVAAICEPGPTEQQITAALGSQPEFQLVEVLTITDRLGREIRAAEPAILLVDHQVGGQPTLDFIDDLAAQFPEAAILAILPDSDPLKAQQVMLAGARAFIIQPFTQVNLLSTLRRVRDLEARRSKSQAETQSKGPEAAPPLRTLAVYSPRGGVGCSTLAANLAVALKDETDARVLLLEGKLMFGHLGVLLNIRTANTLADLIPHANALDESLIREVVVEHASGIHVLLGPGDMQAAQGIRPQDLFNVLAALQRLYDYVVIDAGSAINENTVTMMDAADRILVVTTPDLATLHDASRFIQIGHTLAYPSEKILIALNRAGILGGVKASDIEKALRHELFAQVPDDGPNALRSLNRGIPLLMKYPRSPASQAVRRLAKTLVALQHGDAKPAAAKAAPAKSKGRGRLAPSRSS